MKANFKYKRIMIMPPDNIAPGAIDFSRYEKNPVLLVNHVWSEDPVGMMKDIILQGMGKGRLYGTPHFHLQTEASVRAHNCYALDLYTATMGGSRDAGTGQFTLYEISLILKQ